MPQQTRAFPNYYSKIAQPIHPAPKSGTCRALTVEEKAALWDEAAALHQEARAAQSEIDKLKFKVLSLQGRRDALFTRGRSGGKGKQKQACGLCGMEVCVCERVG